MLKAEIKDVIDEKRKEIERHELYKYANISFYVWLTVICFSICIVGIIASAIFFYYFKNELLLLSISLCSILAVIILHLGLFLIIYYSIKKNRASANILKLESEIEELENKLKDNKDDVSTSIESIKKAKELFEKRILSKEEYELIKARILEKV